MIPQSDFTSLAIQAELFDESQDTDGLTVAIYQGEISGNLLYAPVNVIPDEVAAFVAAWEASTLATSSSGHMDLDEIIAPVSQSLFEPTRRLNDFAPPKRFYRTFWKSTSKRLPALSSMQKLQTK